MPFDAPRCAGSFTRSLRTGLALVPLLLSGSTARATIDAQMNTTNYVPGQASEISIDGVITSGGTSQKILAGTLTLRFDPAKVTIGSLRPGQNGWSVLASNLDHLGEGWAKVALLNQAGQTASGPMLYVTITPVDAQVDVNDCATLKLDGEDSDLADENCQTVFPSDPCSGRYNPLGENASNTSEEPETGAGSVFGTGAGNGPLSVAGEVDIDGARRALQVAGGLLAANEADPVVLDRNGDGTITIADAVAILKTPAPPEPSGWYMFQGNAQHTGMPEQPLSPSLTKKWSADVADSTDTQYVTNGGVWTDNYRYLQPSVVAVPDPLSSATRIYAAVGYMPKPVSTYQKVHPYSRVYRFREANGVLSNSQASGKLEGFYVTGTPLVVGNTIVLTGVLNFPEQSSGDYPARGRVLALDASSLTELWRRDLPGSICTSPVYFAGRTQYTDQTGTVRNHLGGCVIVAADDWFVPAYDSIHSRNMASYSYVYALSLRDGKHVWGQTYRTQDPRDGDLVPDVMAPANTAGGQQEGFNIPTPGGLVPMVFNSTYSSPAIMGDAVYVQDASCWVNARNLLDGTFRWEKEVDNQNEESSISVFDGKMYWGATSLPTGAKPWEGIGGISCIAEVQGANGPDGLPQWTTVDDPNRPPYGETIDAVWSSVVFHPTARIAIFGDLTGKVHGADADGIPADLRTFPRWPSSYDIGSPLFCSPLMAYDTATSRYHAFFGADDGRIHVLQAQETPVGDRQVAVLTDGGNALNGPIRSSMASCNGRLYVVSAGAVNATDGTFTQVPRLYSFGQ